MNGLSKWSNETKSPAKSGKTDYTESKPLLCDCGGSSPIGDGTAQASFFYEDFEWICSSCGRVLAPTLREYEELVL